MGESSEFRVSSSESFGLVRSVRSVDYPGSVWLFDQMDKMNSGVSRSD